jgi:hypothetical protein
MLFINQFHMSVSPGSFIVFIMIVVMPCSASAQYATNRAKKINIQSFFINFSTDSLQGATQSKLPVGYLDKLNQRASQLTGKISATTGKALRKFQKKQERITKKLSKVDAAAAKQMLATSGEGYEALLEKLTYPKKMTQYIPYLDTLSSSLKFLKMNQGALSKISSADQVVQKLLDGAAAKVSGLENELQKAETVKQFLKDHQENLRQQLQNIGFSRELKRLTKDAYYYGQQINDYQESLKDPQKVERKAFELLRKTKVFQDFMQRNSRLAELFNFQSYESGSIASAENLEGLQTRAQLSQAMQNQFGAGGEAALAQLQANGQQAQDILQQLKNKVNQMGAGGRDGEMPDFKPNAQKTKSFLKRLEFGTNIQTIRPNGFFPVTSDLGLSLGFRISDQTIVGVGADWKIGWGKDIQHVRVSYQGAGLRSFLDYKLKKFLWISGGFELNYRSMFNSIEQLKALNAWQPSGLIGLSQKLPFNTRLIKNTKVQLLWDFLSIYQTPRTQNLIFRIGYSIQ